MLMMSILCADFVIKVCFQSVAIGPMLITRIKYAWSAAGYLLISIPVMLTKKQSVGVQTKDENSEFLESITKVNDAVAKRTESAHPNFPPTSHRIQVTNLHSVRVY